MVAAAIARNHRDAGFDVPVHRGAARTALEELAQEDSPRPARALPLDLDCYFPGTQSAMWPMRIAWSAPKCSLLAVIPPQLRHVPAPQTIHILDEPVA